MDKYFVYIKGLKGPQAQLWNDKQTDGNGKEKSVLFIKKLEPYEYNLSLDYLQTHIYKPEDVINGNNV
jgi:hypothetical protein